jgi:hypothetical protein
VLGDDGHRCHLQAASPRRPRARGGREPAAATWTPSVHGYAAVVATVHGAGGGAECRLG